MLTKQRSQLKTASNSKLNRFD